MNGAASFAAVLGVLLVSRHGGEVAAINASPEMYTEVNCGDVYTTGFLRIWGTPEYHGVETASGYTTLRDPDNDNCMVYAMKDVTSGQLKPSPYIVGKDDPPEELPPHLREDSSVRSANCAANEYCRFKMNAQRRRLSTDSSLPTVVTEGTLKNLVILMQFADHTSRRLPSPEEVEVLFNADEVGGAAATGSVKTSLQEFSYGKLTVDSTVTSEWITIGSNEKDCAGDEGASGLHTGFHACVSEVLQAAHASLDLGLFDAVTILHSGYAAEYGGDDSYGTPFTKRIWSHHWAVDPSAYPADLGLSAYQYQITSAIWTKSGHSIARIGAVLHEMGQYLGLPALYDSSGLGNGIGSYGLMSNPWGFDGSQWYPPHPCAWSKILLGWVDGATEVHRLTTDGDFTIAPIQTTPQVYRIDAGFPKDEYLLLEYRGMIGLDSKLPQDGLLIWHIDELVDQSLEGEKAHYRVALVQADGEKELEMGKDRGDSDDVFHPSWHNGIGPDGVYSNEEAKDTVTSIRVAAEPNTNSYRDGVSKPSGVSIKKIQPASEGTKLSFSFEGPAAPLQQPSVQKPAGDGNCLQEGSFCAVGDADSCCEGYTCDDFSCKET